MKDKFDRGPIHSAYMAENKIKILCTGFNSWIEVVSLTNKGVTLNRCSKPDALMVNFTLDMDKVTCPACLEII